jgi:hypothetical protein
MNHRRFAKAPNQQSRGRAYSQNSSGASALRRASRRTREREWGLPTPRIEAAHEVIVHEQLADDTKGKKDKGIRLERTAEADRNE